jgi:hypothetical protein
VKTPDTGSDVGLILMKWSDTATEKNYWLGKLNDTSVAFYVDESENVTASLSLVNDGIYYHHVVGVADPDSSPMKLRIYVDGIEINSVDWDGTSRTGQEFEGTIDEVRVQSTNRSACWIGAEYSNQSNPEGFYTIGIEEQPGTVGDPFQNGWTYRKRLTIDASRVAGDLNNFPVLISTTDLDWKEDSQAIPGHVAQTDGGDIIFTAGDGITKLDHEIEKYDPATGELVAWVEVRSVSSTNNTNIYIYYGNTSLAEGENQWNPVGVWDSNYVGVWHLKETPTVDPLAYDSTANDNDASFLADMTSDDQVDGRIDGALDFDASSNNDRVIASDNPSLGNMSDLTIETWVKLKEYPSTSSYFLSYKNHSADPWFSWQFMVTNWGDPFYLEVNGTPLTPLGGNYGSCASNTVPNTTDWYHVVGVYQNGQTPRIYVNGVDDTAWSNGTPPSGNIGDTDGDFSIGWNVKGMQDEFRISKVARSAAWIETEYNNQKAPAAFYTVGIEETTGTGADPFNNGWIYRKKITIDASKVPSDLTNFPVLINTTDPDLTAALANFNDILFTAGDGSTKLDHEIEKYNSSRGALPFRHHQY